MGRSRKSAKAAGASFERLIADGLRDALGDKNIQRAPRWGSVDKGDIINVRIDGQDLVIQTKDVTRLDLPKGVGDAKLQAVNAGALAGLFIHKRKGTTDPMKQWVSCTVAELVALITKVPVHAGAVEGNEGRADDRHSGE
ncbi:hypothetical protein BONGO_71 [Mycobacterium phage Bongo]|uniref:Holliday junction resolvase n=5 Tax=Bongovirus bongo TaxID=1983750 RepID=A0A0M4R085_9CAUD|nr:hypothetical protein PEGLEG_70 [Mycobacterium phage PegLeg]YP_009604929.1 hypothetical protein FDH95_gp071 [Mycobacterium phage Bongo]ALF00598.1 hypothetical protein SEA_BRICOLE_70 [Mycobacterium phage Bricole]AXQ52712.1 holliday junction resolvase [Mycobacterium phage IPhane7]QDH93645.1 holliday junction resolvase [Mycobacterium phage LilhomieP]QUU29272.1 holliday junction resolvase [Mycobacterium phage SirSheldon]WNM75353.1 Holliday junction resolvase [Mycobacterium phage Auspice]